MAAYSLLFKESVQKDFDGISKKDLRKIPSRIKSLATDPRPPGCERLTGRDRYRVRQGRYRIVYAVQGKEGTLTIVKVGHRKDVHR